jgi:hypothetical protein
MVEIYRPAGTFQSVCADHLESWITIPIVAALRRAARRDSL